MSEDRSEQGDTPNGPAFIAMMPPSPETSQRWYSMYCRACGVEEMMTATADDPRLIAHRDEHNRRHHTPTGRRMMEKPEHSYEIIRTDIISALASDGFSYLEAEDLVKRFERHVLIRGNGA